jgi:uroporphyrinogen decarboxylase
MDKRERLDNTLLGRPVDRAPVALWRHFPGDDQRAADFARAVLSFQKTYDWDFVKVTPFSAYCVADYGVQTKWCGDLSGDRATIKYPVTRSLDWTELRTLDPLRGETGKHINALNIICEGLRDDDTPVLTTVYSPLTQASMIAEGDLMLRNLRTHSDRLQSGLNIITESTLRFIDALKRTSIAGIVYIMSYADFSLLSADEYANFGVPYDRKILNSLPDKWRLNILQPGRSAPMFELAATYPLPVIHWDSCAARPDFDKASLMFKGVLCGGLDAERDLHLGTPTTVQDVAREAINRMGSRRLILATGEPVPVSAPLSNLHAAREAVETIKAV